MTAPIRSVLVVAAGLDLLHSTRLKLACSLLLAERIDVTLRTWDDAAPLLEPDLVVLGQEPSAALALARLPAARHGQLTIRRDPFDLRDDIGHGATVRDIHERLRQRLQQPAAGEQAPRAAAIGDVPLPLRAIQDATSPRLFVRGALRIAFEPAQACLSLPAELTLEALLAELALPGWESLPLARGETAALPRRLSTENLFFAIANRHPAWLPPPSAPGQPLQLRQWPDLSEEAASASLLVAIAYLHARPWQAAALAASCKLPLQAVEGLFAAASASGLAQYQEIPMSGHRPRRSASTSRFLSWVGRRFGLTLGGAATA